MDLTFRDIEKAFKVEEQTLYQWINNLGMPVVKANDQYYFNSVEVLEWVLKNKIALSSAALKLCEKSRLSSDIFTQALRRGGVYSRIDGVGWDNIFSKVLELLPLPGHIQKDGLKDMLLSREQAGTTCIGNGIAIPHVKHPVIFAGVEPIVGLFFLEHPVDIAAFDAAPVQTLFVMFTGSFKLHLSLLSRLAFCLQDSSVKAAIGNRVDAEQIIARFHIVESKIVENS